MKKIVNFIGYILIFFIVYITSSINVIPTYGQVPTCTGSEVLVDNVCRKCYELGTCDFFGAPLDTMMEPYLGVFGAYFFIIIWGFLIGILWLRVSNTMLVSVVGLVLAVIIQSQFSVQAQTVGYVLVVIAAAVVLYQIFTVRTHFPTN